MSLTDDNLLMELPHSLGFGLQRLYRIGNYGLSCVNPKILHSYPFAWEIATIKYKGEDTNDFDLVYDTGLTGDVEVFYSDEETNEFIEKAFVVFKEMEKEEKQ